MKKAMFMTMAALGVTAFMLMAQDLSKFNGTWKNEKGTQTRKLTVKDGVIYMEEDNANGKQIRRMYATNGELVTPTETTPVDYGVWAGAKVKGRTEGNKVIVDTESLTFGNWHDEWTMAADGKSYTALRVSTGGAKGGGKGPGGGAPPAAGPGGGAPGGPGGGGKGPGGPGGGKGGPAEPETFFKQ